MEKMMNEPQNSNNSNKRAVLIMISFVVMIVALITYEVLTKK